MGEGGMETIVRSEPPSLPPGVKRKLLSNPSSFKDALSEKEGGRENVSLFKHVKTGHVTP